MSVVTRSMTNGAQGAMRESGDRSPAMLDDVSEGGGSKSENELKLKIEALRLELQLAQSNAKQAEEEARRCKKDAGERRKMSEYAKELRAVLAQMPDADSMVPGWFKNVDTLFASLSIPAEVQGAIILPFLTERMRGFSANQSDGRIMPYPELKEKILRELKMTANEYRRLFLTSQKTDGESWAQFSTKLETFFLYYLNSREIQTLDQLKHLIVSDRLKQLMPDEVRTYVLQNETKGWLRPKEVVELAENFDESRRGRKPQGREKASDGVPIRGRDGQSKETAPTTAGGEGRGADRTRAIRCFGCGRMGHIQRSCQQARRQADEGQGNQDKHDPRKLVAQVASMPTETAKACVEKGGMSLRWVDLVVADRPLKACLDSGAEITVLRLETVPAACLKKSKGTIKLKGAFGQVVTADLAYVPLSLVAEGENTGQQVLTLCAITDKLSERLGALLTPEVYEELLQVRSVLKREAVEMQVMENEIDRDFRQTPEDTLGEKVLEFETAENEEKTDADGDDCGDIEVEPAIQTGKPTRKMDDDDGWPGAETLLERQKGEDPKEDRKENAYGEDRGGREVKPVNRRAGADEADAPTGDPVTQGGESGSGGDGGDEGTNLVGDIERRDPGNPGAPVTAALGRQGPSQAGKKRLRKGRSGRSESAVEGCSGSSPASTPDYDADDHGENVDDGERTTKRALIPPIQA
ncbi:hypothetical protein HPB47_021878 [Ixodes persulcatus]|uniref:Uncharacterized protein n=1 Tax=Ixodes persulcatus TaxID=34615 RepID=A0AC60QD38_IXOPE|nr:hypothetical protein HPB47_021878 [Ixodes persulcatus]